ncbi:ABC transporter substrate-binding protein [Nakamurella antarctica]|nr:ABC transporter substrate-binding protein [Nakamurella antarctica]
MASSAGSAGAVDLDAAKATLIASGKLTVCTHLSYAPFQFDDGTGKIVGFDVDIMDAVAKKLGVEQTIVDTPFEGIKAGVDTKAGKCDASAAAMSITPEREKVILFSEPYFNATQAMIIRAADDYPDLKSLAGKRVGGQAGTVGLDYLNANSAANGYEVVEYPDLPSQGTALLTNQIDAAVNDSPVWKDLVDKNAGKFKVTASFDTGDQYGIGMKLGNDALKAVVDATLEELKADKAYDDIYKKWIGDVPAS